MDPNPELTDMPEGALILGRLHMIWYIDPESGEQRLYLEHDTEQIDAPYVLGHLELAKQDIMAEAKIGPFDEHWRTE